ncbi:MAG: hypothetical protein AAFQ10_12320 [Pseudomonadota bacterium]
MDTPIPEQILGTLVKDWPTLLIVVLFAAALWVLFRRHLLENARSIENMNAVVSNYKELNQQVSADSERYRIISQALISENEKIREQYNDIRHDLQNLMLENNRLKALVEATNEMTRATGSDVKVISKDILRARAEIDSVSDRISALPNYSSHP